MDGDRERRGFHGGCEYGFIHSPTHPSGLKRIRRGAGQGRLNGAGLFARIVSYRNRPERGERRFLFLARFINRFQLPPATTSTGRYGGAPAAPSFRREEEWRM